VSREELDRLLDRELSPERRRELVGRLRRDPRALDELLETRRAVGMLREPVPGPDLTERVLHDVGRRRGFLSSRLRRRVRQGRVAAAAAVLAGLFTLGLAHRLHPEMFRLGEAETPVADFGDAVRQDSIDGGERLKAAVERLTSAGEGELRTVTRAAVIVENGGLASFPVDVEREGPRVSLEAATDDEVLSVAGVLSRELPRSAVSWPDSGVLVGLPLTESGAWPASAGVRSSGVETGSGVAPGVLPLSFTRGPASAYVGRMELPLERLEASDGAESDRRE
jgi:hypothetical protein